MFVLACLAAGAVFALARAPSSRRGVRVVDHSKTDFTKRPPPPAPMRRAGIEIPYRNIG